MSLLEPLSTDLFGQTPREAAIDVLHAATAIYTREPVVDQLLDSVNWPGRGRRLLDSSCGDGAFLGRALQRLLAQQPAASDASIQAQLAGFEIHHYAAAEARQRLRQVLVDHGRSYSQASALAVSLVRCADFLTEAPHQVADVIVGNPPYLRLVNVPQPLRAEYEATLPAYATADLLLSFLDACAKRLSPTGELAFVTADRWLFNAGAAQLREVVGQRFGLARVQRLDVTSAFYRPKLRKAGTLPRVHPVAVVLRPNGPGTQPLSRQPIFPGESAYVAPAVSHGTLQDVAEIRLAPWLGTPGVFVVGADIAARLPADATTPVVDSDDISGGVLRPAQRFAIRTRPDSQPHPAVIAHLERTMPTMCARGRRTGRVWLPPEPFHDFDLGQASLLVPRIAKTLRPVAVPAGRLPINHNVSIVRAGSWSLQRIAALLASEEAAAWVRHHAAPLENDYWSLTTRLLRTLPLFDTAATRGAV